MHSRQHGRETAAILFQLDMCDFQDWNKRRASEYIFRMGTKEMHFAIQMSYFFYFGALLNLFFFSVFKTGVIYYYRILRACPFLYIFIYLPSLAYIAIKNHSEAYRMTEHGEDAAKCCYS